MALDWYINRNEGLAEYRASQNKWVLEFNSYLLPDDNYSITTYVYDLASTPNSASATIDIVEIDNVVLHLYGAAATDGRGGFFFRRRGLLSFYLESMVPTTLTLTQMKIGWGGNSRIDWIYSIYDDVTEQFWLSEGSNIGDDVQFAISIATGGVNISSALGHHLTVSFDDGDRPTTVDFTISIYIEQLSTWEVFIVDNV